MRKSMGLTSDKMHGLNKIILRAEPRKKKRQVEFGFCVVDDDDDDDEDDDQKVLMRVLVDDDEERRK